MITTHLTIYDLRTYWRALRSHPDITGPFPTDYRLLQNLAHKLIECRESKHDT